MTKRKHTLEERIQAARGHLEDGKSFSEISVQYGATAQVVRNWGKRYQEMDVAGSENRRGKRLAFRSQALRMPEEALRIENARLEQENYLLKMEQDLLKR